ncbi:alpha/beta fold hydrolase [Leptospira kanakyensis]|uniref:alpha/beta fold hydrolase n=1 Tax=Leptospira kanakyensis TaxID=2484968 RepID=UPI00223E3971|nr:alpha/beta hydrolase [Leptospira kanakyensis]MCW7471507.1 alpha/beta hydrolase [Leptospira kanakyensis]MCW7482238.1 alpha/beta hydrolase [Leptospira kanakyensis]
MKKKQYLYIVWMFIFLLFCFLLYLITSSIELYPEEGKEVLETQFIPTKQGNLFISNNVCLSKQKLLIFIHGSPGSGSDFSMYLKEKDLQKKYCILTPDRLGFGNSYQNPFVPGLGLQAEAITEMIQYFLNQKTLSFQEITILGHSYGGPIAFKVAILLQGRIPSSLKVVLLSAPIDPKWEELKFYNHLAKKNYIQWFLPNTWVRSNEEMFPLKSELEWMRDEVIQSKISVLSIHGEEDYIVPLEHVKYLESISYQGNHRTYLIDGGGHLIPWTSFSEITSILTREDI